MPLTPLTRKRATDEVYESLREAILSRVFKPGQRLLVEEISRDLGVSLTPVRHALQQLATEGLIDIHPRSGTYVASVSAREIEETFDIRCALECLAAERAVERMSAADRERMRELLRTLARPVNSEQSLHRHEKANTELHQLLIDASGNARLKEMYESLNAHIKIARAHNTELTGSARMNWQERLKVEHAEHEAIVAAVEAHDLPVLTSTLRKHITRARDQLAASLREMEQRTPPAQPAPAAAPAK